MHIVDALDFGVRLNGDRIKAAHLREFHKGRPELRQRLHVVFGRMCSSLSRMVSPLVSLTGSIDLLKRRAENADMALVRLEEFEDEWGKRYPAIGQAWRRAGNRSCRSSRLLLASAR